MSFVAVAVPRPLQGLYTYRVSSEQAALLRKGGWVVVPFGRSKTHAFIVERDLDEKNLGDVALDKIKSIHEIGDPELGVPETVFDLCNWVSAYYQVALGEVLAAAAPASALGLRTKGAPREWDTRSFEPTRVTLTPAQNKAYEGLEAAWKTRSSVLLDGVTGSGKTELYLKLARAALAEGRSVLLLVPEIALTPQLHSRFEAGLGTRVGLWHSAIPNGQRRDQWNALLKGHIRVLVGARSAIFAPLRDLGLIIVDEEHDPTYKQDERVRYHARDVAIVRGKKEKACVVLGSATPSLESLTLASAGKHRYVPLKERVHADAGLPDVKIVHLKKEELVPNMQAPFAKETIEAIRQEIERGKQVMIYLNRRGFAAFLVCSDCGEVPQCQNCSVSMTFHKRPRSLVCHSCGYREAVPETCSKCFGAFIPAGAGTESLEEELPKRIPGFKSIRLDRDQITSATRLEAALEEFRSGGANVLIGTQMLAKGHDFPNVTLVVVVLADALFRWPDFRANERAYQVLTQVSGRAGRGAERGKVIIQTFAPDHSVLQVVTGAKSVESLLSEEKEIRTVLGYPPFGRLARLRFDHPTQEVAKRVAQTIALNLSQISGKPGEPDAFEILGPTEAMVERVKGIYRWELMIRARQVSAVQRAIASARKICHNVIQGGDQSRNWPMIVDIDPYQSN